MPSSRHELRLDAVHKLSEHLAMQFQALTQVRRQNAVNVNGLEIVSANRRCHALRLRMVAVRHDGPTADRIVRDVQMHAGVVNDVGSE